MEDGLGIIGLALFLGILAFFLYVGWRIHAKAGRPGWTALVPIYNLFVLLRIVGRPAWWILLLLLPLVNFFAAIVLCIDLAKSFGKGAGFGLGLALLGFIFGPILAFGSAEYVGPAAQQNAAPAFG